MSLPVICGEVVCVVADWDSITAVVANDTARLILWGRRCLGGGRMGHLERDGTLETRNSVVLMARKTYYLKLRPIKAGEA